MLALEGEAFGTTWSLRVVRPPLALDAAGIRTLVTRELERVDAAMSTWRDDSELALFNRARSTDWFPVSPATAAVAALALRASRGSEGAFDPTVAPLVALWGFARSEPAALPPPAAAIDVLRERVGYERLDVRAEPPALRKRTPALELDLSGVAKGHAVDSVSEALVAHGGEHFLIEIGGELRARGRNARGEPWRVAIEQPANASPRRAQAILALADAALATSGPYRNFFVSDGERHSHLLDPRTGRPVRHGLLSVSVVAESAAWADALATALLVLGPERGFALAERQGLAVLFVTDGAEGTASRSTPAFERLRSRP